MSKHHIRFDHALWYAWGQQDAGIGKGLDATAFAEVHAAQAMESDSGKRTFLPSIQDAWRTWVEERPLPTHIRTITAIDDDVAAFLFKSVTEAAAIDDEPVDEDVMRGDR